MVSSHVVISVSVGMMVFLALHVLIWRCRPSDSPRIFLLELLAGAGTLVSLGLALGLSGFQLFDLCTVLWIDVFFVILYTFFYAGLSRSVSITLMARLFTSGNSRLDLNTLVQEYNESSRFEDRIRLMEHSGFLSVLPDCVWLTPKGFALARGARLLGRVLGDGLRG